MILKAYLTRNDEMAVRYRRSGGTRMEASLHSWFLRACGRLRCRAV